MAARSEPGGHPGAVEHHGDGSEHSPGILVRPRERRVGEKCGVHAATVGMQRRETGPLRP